MAEPLRYSIVVPVHNEAARIEHIARTLLEELPAGGEIVFVCNGCTDASEVLLRPIAQHRATILVRPRGKAGAIRAGEAVVTALPRFYVDSDVLFPGHGFAPLLAALAEPDVELVSPRIDLDLAGTGRAARGIARIWRQLPHGRDGAFHHVLGVSAAGRARWGEFPDLLGDDAFIESRIADTRKRVVGEVAVTVRLPRTLAAWIGVRARWERSHRQLRAAGIVPPHRRGQHRALARALIRPRTMAPALLYTGVTLVARALARARPGGADAWYRDASTR